MATPVTVGVTTRTVVIPLACEPLARRHRPRGDRARARARPPARSPVGFVAQINRCVFWFHPLAWWLPRTLSVLAEHACDDAAVRAIGEPRRYAEILIDMAEAMRRRDRRASWQALGMDGNGFLAERIDRILGGGVKAPNSITSTDCRRRFALVLEIRRVTSSAALLATSSDGHVRQALARERFEAVECDGESARYFTLAASPESVDAVPAIVFTSVYASVATFARQIS